MVASHWPATQTAPGVVVWTYSPGTQTQVPRQSQVPGLPDETAGGRVGLRLDVERRQRDRLGDDEALVGDGPVAGLPNELAAVVLPVAGHPVGTGERRLDPAAGAPGPAFGSPLPAAGDPNVLERRGGGDDFLLARWDGEVGRREDRLRLEAGLGEARLPVAPAAVIARVRERMVSMGLCDDTRGAVRKFGWHVPEALRRAWLVFDAALPRPSLGALGVPPKRRVEFRDGLSI